MTGVPYLADQVPEHIQRPDNVHQARRQDDDDEGPADGKVSILLRQHAAGGLERVLRDEIVTDVDCAGWVRCHGKTSTWPLLPVCSWHLNPVPDTAGARHVVA